MTNRAKPLTDILLKPVLIFISTLIVAIVAFYSKINFAFLSVITTFVLLQLFFKELYLKSIERILGAVIAFILMLLILRFFHTHIVIELALASILVFIFMYFYAQEQNGYAMVMGSITIAFMAAFSYSDGWHAAARLGAFWVVNIALGIVGAMFCYMAFKYLGWGGKAAYAEKLPYNKFEFKQAIRSVMALIYPFKPVPILLALRVTLSLLVVIAINLALHWQFVLVQAVIAVTVVTVQFKISKTHERALLRIIGVLAGSGVALIYSYIFHYYDSGLLLIVLIALSLFICSLCSNIWPKLEYAFLQAGIMVPLVLFTSIGPSDQGTQFVVERALGSLEGGVIGVAMVYLFYPLLRRVEG